MKLSVSKVLSLFAMILCLSQTAMADRGGRHGHDLRDVVGAWSGQVEITDPAGVEGFPTMLTFNQGGTMSEIHPLFSVDRVGLGNLMATPGHGVWEKVAKGYYKASFQLYIQGGPGNENYEGQLIGTNHINYFIMISEDGQQMKAKWASKMLSPEGVEIIGGGGSFEGTRINVAPLP
ncbi:MAG TPA: hypothetical protein DHW71_15975 [Gammaproteobacteria bacterium]|nr:hypothetical protein [Gammaproteobacteria bacterium]MEC8010617.1 hypothetical protein [Pseudomonadota bacterium]HBF07442.1 hypothetical protein [Gammaproteobacteria bacterium]HCK94493.1 hypothetical protein [Gammaproteobacteria bacterium]